jgi:acyl dehydratase
MTAHLLDVPPSLASSYLRALPFPRRSHRVPGTAPSPTAGLPSDRLAVRHDLIDRDLMARYDRVCGFRVADELAPTFPHVLGFPLAMHLMTRRDFPLPLLGLVHIRNVITQHGALTADQPLTIEVFADNLRPHRAGQQVDVHTVAVLEHEVAWEETSTYLRRGPRPPARTAETATVARPRSEPQPTAEAPVIRWRVAADIGRRYAAVSGDRNPIHLFPVTAKAFGFPRAIAHGMWLAARTLAAIEPRLPSAYSVEIDFKAPVSLPATVELEALPGSGPSAGGWELKVHTVSTGKPNLIGTIAALSL